MHEWVTEALSHLGNRDNDRVESLLHKLDGHIGYLGRKIDALRTSLEELAEERDKLRQIALVLSGDCKTLAEVRTIDKLAMQDSTNKQNASLQEAFQQIVELASENERLREQLGMPRRV